MAKSQLHIVIHHLSKRYKNANVDSLTDINLIIKEQDKFGVIGPNGAGKTTLLSIMCGILPATSGKVDYLYGDHVINQKKQKTIMGFVPQEYAFYEELTPVQNLTYFGALYNLSKQEITKSTATLLAILGLSEYAHKRIRTFSSGMKRRINLAIGIIHDPKILFLDEPTVGIDVQSKHAIFEFLNKLNKNGTTIIYTSHQLYEAEMFCNRIALLDNGKLILQDNTKDLLRKNGVNNLQDLFIQLTGGEYRDGNV